MPEPSIDSNLQALTDRIEQLLARLEQLRAENHRLLENERAWQIERMQLIEKNDLAREKVEAMILRLKALEQD